MVYPVAPAEAPVSDGMVYDWSSANVTNALLELNGKGNFFASPVQTYKPFAQDFIREQITDAPKPGVDHSIEYSRMPDHYLSTAIEIGLPGIIGQQGPEGTTHEFPYLVSSSECSTDPSLSNCIPVQERLAVEVDFDLVDSGIAVGGSLVSNPFCHYVDGAVQRALDRVTLTFTSQDVFPLTHLGCWVEDELRGKPGKEYGAEGHRFAEREELINASLYGVRGVIDIPMPYSVAYTQSLKRVQSQLSDIKMKVRLADWKDLIVCSDERTVPYTSKADPTKSTWLRDASNRSSHDRVADSVLKSTTHYDYLYCCHQVAFLPEALREEMITKAGSSDINGLANVQKQYDVSLENKGKSSAITTKFTGTQPIHEIVVVPRLQDNIDANDWMNTTCIGPESGGRGTESFGNGSDAAHAKYPRQRSYPRKDILSSISMKVYDQPRMAETPAEVLRTQVIRRLYAKMPSQPIYPLPLSLFPTDLVGGSGAVNPARTTGITVSCKFVPEVQDSSINIQLSYILNFWIILSYLGHTATARFQYTVTGEAK